MGSKGSQKGLAQGGARKGQRPVPLASTARSAVTGLHRARGPSPQSSSLCLQQCSGLVDMEAGRALGGAQVTSEGLYLTELHWEWFS